MDTTEEVLDTHTDHNRGGTHCRALFTTAPVRQLGPALLASSLALIWTCGAQTASIVVQSLIVRLSRQHWQCVGEGRNSFMAGTLDVFSHYS